VRLFNFALRKAPLGARAFAVGKQGPAPRCGLRLLIWVWLRSFPRVFIGKVKQSIAQLFILDKYGSEATATGDDFQELFSIHSCFPTIREQL
jgi:hypothetical protein